MAAAKTALIGLATSSVKNFADYEQLVGGVETMFKDSSSLVMEYANNAFKTAGLSSNQYMGQVTSFSARLLQGLGGDTKEAARMADLAVQDMADNAISSALILGASKMPIKGSQRRTSRC